MLRFAGTGHKQLADIIGIQIGLIPIQRPTTPVVTAVYTRSRVVNKFLSIGGTGYTRGRVVNAGGV